MPDLNLAPITFDNSGNQIWANIANTFREDTLYKRKLMYDEMKNRNEIQSSLVPGLDKLGWSNEMKAQEYAGIVKDSANYFKENKGKTSADLVNYLNNRISGVTQKDVAIKQVYANVEKQVADLDPKSVNKGQVRHALLQVALYDPETKALKTEISQEPQDLDKLLNEHPEFYRVDNAQEELGKIITGTQFIDSEDSKKIIQNGKNSTTVTQKNTFNKALSTIDKDPKSLTYGDPILKRDADGLLDNSAFDLVMKNPNIRASSILQTRQFIKHYNEATPEQKATLLNSGELSGEDDVDAVIKKYGFGNKLNESDPDVQRQIQRAFMTNHLSNTMGGTKHGESDAIKFNQPPPANININNVPPARDLFSPLNAKFDNPDTKYVSFNGKSIGIPLNSVDKDTQLLAIKAAEDLKPKPKGKQWGNNELVLDRDSDGSIGIYPFNAKTGERGVKISTISSENININANKDLGTKEKIKAVKNPKPSGKTMAKEDYAKLTPTQRQAFIASGGSIK